MKNQSQAYIQRLLTHHGKDWDEKGVIEFASQETTSESITTILNLQKNLMEKWEIRTIALKFKEKSIVLPNATENSPYLFSFEKDFFVTQNIQSYEFQDLAKLGLSYNKDTLTIDGCPSDSGITTIDITYKVDGELESDEPHIKKINLVINPDPKSLWKNIPSDKEAIFWKEDDFSNSGIIVDKKIVVSSKRGRSHQNVGSFRDDDFAFKNFEDSGWGVVVVSDGAGSSPLSRKGSNLACNEVIKYFEDIILPNKELENFENVFKNFIKTKDETEFESAKNEVKKVLYKASLHVHNEINNLANKTVESNPEILKTKNVKYNSEFFHATLIFTAVKKIKDNYLILTFGVGDCPIGIMNKEKTEARLLNWLDVGEFGGGTRFITQPDIFHSNERPMSTRFNIHVQKDFSFLFLMSDGIYDPKFEVEANLEKTEKWLEFIADLEGENEDNINLEFNSEIEVVEKNLNTWMDFWSKGNHDDRTLAIIF